MYAIGGQAHPRLALSPMLLEVARRGTAVLTHFK